MQERNEITEDDRQFAAYLHAARALWRSHRELVEAEKFPERLVPALEADPESTDCSEYHCKCGKGGP